MTSAFTSALNRARDAFDRNLIKRGQSRDSIETNDSPFGSSLVTPVDADGRVNIPHNAPDIAKFLESTAPDNLQGRSESSSSAPMMDYFGFKNYNLQSGFPLSLLRSRTFQSSETSAGTPPVKEVQTRHSTLGFMSAMLDDDARPSPGCSTPGSIEEESLERKNSIYNFPNKPIVIKVRKSECSFSKETSRSRVESSSDPIHSSSIPESENSSVSRLSSELCGGPVLDYDLDDIESPHPLWFLGSVFQSHMAVATLFFKAILFVPWCISVGGTILLCPDELEVIAFQTGYVDSTRGIRRFAHWADVGIQLVMIFLAFFLCLLWILPILVGISLVFALGTRFVLVWKGVRVDYSVPLGENDKQSFYLLAILGERGLMKGTQTVTKTEAGYFVIPT